MKYLRILPNIDPLCFERCFESKETQKVNKAHVHNKLCHNLRIGAAVKFNQVL